MNARIFLYTISLAMFPAIATGQWQEQKILGGKIYDITAIGNNLFFCGDAGIFLSTNDGDSWKQMLSYPTTCLTVFDTTLYAGTSDGNIIQSIDGGKSWVITAKIGTWSVQNLTAGENYILASSGSNIYYSGNGQSWQKQVSGDGIVTSIIQYNGVSIACFYNATLSRSVNGYDWKRMDSTPCCVTILSTDGKNIFASSLDGHIYVSSDSGSTWQQTIAKQASFFSKGSNICVGLINGNILQYDDTKKSWTTVTVPFPITNVHCIFAHESTIFISTGNSIFRTTNNGSTWIEVGTPFINAVKSSTYSFSHNGNQLFAGTEEGIFCLMVSCGKNSLWIIQG